MHSVLGYAYGTWKIKTSGGIGQRQLVLNSWLKGEEQEKGAISYENFMLKPLKRNQQIIFFHVSYFAYTLCFGIMISCVGTY